MSTRQYYRKLHTFFVEVCADPLYAQLHVQNYVPENGREMFEYLQKTLPVIHRKDYFQIIWNCKFLLPEQKKYLLPDNGVIDVENIDIAMYIKINSLFDGETHFLWSKVNKVRNYVSHIPMVHLQGVSTEEDDFNNKFIAIKKCLFDSRLLSWERLNHFEHWIINN